jgi:hypothetical protein
MDRGSASAARLIGFQCPGYSAPARSPSSVADVLRNHLSVLQRQLDGRNNLFHFPLVRVLIAPALSAR